MLHISASQLGLLDGVIEAHGNHGRYGSGGGSGGTIVLQTFFSHGWGNVIADGGNSLETQSIRYCGTRYGGGGGGGRIKVMSPSGISKPLFWKRRVNGGTSARSSYNGQPGTICPLNSVDYFEYYDFVAETRAEMHSCGCQAEADDRSINYSEGQRLCSGNGLWNVEEVCIIMY